MSVPVDGQALKPGASVSFKRDRWVVLSQHDRMNTVQLIRWDANGDAHVAAADIADISAPDGSRVWWERCYIQDLAAGLRCNGAPEGAVLAWVTEKSAEKLRWLADLELEHTGERPSMGDIIDEIVAVYAEAMAEEFRPLPRLVPVQSEMS